MAIQSRLSLNTPQFGARPQPIKRIQKRWSDHVLASSIKSENGMGQHYTNPQHPVVQRSVQLANELDAKDILEIGTGSGIVSKQLTKKTNAKRIVATDINPDGIDRINNSRQSKRIQTRLFDTSKPLPNDLKNRFDLVIAKDVLPFLDPKGVMSLLNNAMQALKPGGQFFFTAPSTYSHLFTKNQANRADQPLYKTLSQGDRDFIQTTQTAFSFESIGSAFEKLQKVGLELIDAQRYGRAKGWLMFTAEKPNPLPAIENL